VKNYMAAAIVGAAIMGLSAPTKADVTYTGYTVLNDQNVTVTFADGSTEYGGAGQITLTGVNNGNGYLNTWCIDLADNLSGEGIFNEPALFLNQTAWKINALISNGTAILGTNYDASAAIQVAIWEELFPDVTITADNGNVNMLASDFLMRVDDGLWAGNPQVFELVKIGNQTQAYVSEPTAMMILGVGIAGMMTIRRRTISAIA
jgi:hypothetical protein